MDQASVRTDKAFPECSFSGPVLVKLTMERMAFAMKNRVMMVGPEATVSTRTKGMMEPARAVQVDQ